MYNSPLLSISTEICNDAIRVSNILNSKYHYDISRQLLRACLSIGANIREAQYAESKKDFVHKLHISLKECNESIFW